MFALIRMSVIGLVLLTVIYVVVSVYSRSVRREKLENRWDAEHPQGGDPEARDAYIEAGMVEYQNGLRRKLILLVYIIPIVLVMVMIYLTNWS